MKNIAMPTNRAIPSVRPTDMPIIAPVDKEPLLEDVEELEDAGAAVDAAVEVAAVLVEDEPGAGGDMLNGGEK